MSESYQDDPGVVAAGAPAPPESTPAPEAPGTGEAAGSPNAPGADEATGTPGAAEVPEAPRRRRVLRAVGRWTAAVTLFGTLGGGIAYGITVPERTDVPGLGTRSDGRWDYPELELPALPSGSPRPFAEGNEAEVHHADVRDLLLPPPAGARAAEKPLPGVDGDWVSLEDFAARFREADRGTVVETLDSAGVRHIAGRGWSMPDGTRTSVYLLRFPTGATAGEYHADVVASGLSPELLLSSAPSATLDDVWPEKAQVPNVERYSYDELKPRGEEHVRQAWLIAGDTVALVVQSREGKAHEVPFQQTVILQSQLLG
ncbi:hypothetical protein [Streptomyces sp. JJ36]|uniref:hypothetical protein n=1 Tax=Streptomyces sp. JJ36 TaxID=2736645 RepID=UPI001F47CC7E|nr:hypothetical protein [Streptomyces sp. JJ36]MCF6524166.1 hypothetical protein [Streptomyces sp. JJ36]